MILEGVSFTGNKIFISYKYRDTNVYPLKNVFEEAVSIKEESDYTI